MKKSIVFLLFSGIAFIACKDVSSAKKEPAKEKNTPEYDAFGAKITTDTILTAAKMLEKFKNLTVGDTIQVAFTSNINEVCSKKGYWMKLSLDTTTETMVRFKDYDFFMPPDAKGIKVIVAGMATVKETSVADLKHYAEDAGKTKEDIAKITAPKLVFTFEASGVLMKK